MKKGEIWQAVKFTLFSASAGLIQIGTYTLFYEVFHWAPWLAYLVSLVLSVLWNFTFNRKFTFHSTSNVGRAMALVALYYLVFTPLIDWRGGVSAAAGEQLCGADRNDAHQFCDGIPVSEVCGLPGHD